MRVELQKRLFSMLQMYTKVKAEYTQEKKGEKRKAEKEGGETVEKPKSKITGQISPNLLENYPLIVPLPKSTESYNSPDVKIATNIENIHFLAFSKQTQNQMVSIDLFGGGFCGGLSLWFQGERDVRHETGGKITYRLQNKPWRAS